MELVGAHEVLGLLRDLAVAGGGNELGRDGGVEDREQHLPLRVLRVVRGHPLDEAPHQGLRHAGVDAVHRDVVAGEGGPAEGDLGEVPGADHDPALLVREVHEDLGALAGLEVLVGGALAVPRVEADVPDVLLAGGPDVDLPQLGARRGGEAPRALQGAGGRAEPGHGHREDAGAREAQEVEGPHADEEGEGRVEPPGEAEDDTLHPHVLDPPGEAGGLDREDLAAPLVEGRGVGGDERVRVHRPHEPVGRGRGHGVEGHGAVGGKGGVDRVGERGLARTLDAQPLDVHVGHHELALAAEALALGEEDAVLGHEQVAAEDEVGRGLVDAGVRVDVRRERAARLLAHELPAVLGLGHEVVRGRRVQQHGGARDRVARARGDRRPEVLADLDGEGDPGVLRELEEEVRAEGGRLAGEAHLGLAGLARRGEPPLLVVLLVAGEERLGHDPEDPARLQHRRRVEEPASLEHRQAHDDDRRSGRGLPQHALERPLGARHQRGQAEEEVPAGVAGEPQLGQHQDLRALPDRPPHELERRVGVPLRVGHPDRRTRRRHPQKAKRRCNHDPILTAQPSEVPRGVWGDGVPPDQRKLGTAWPLRVPTPHHRPPSPVPFPSPSPSPAPSHALAVPPDAPTPHLCSRSRSTRLI